VPQAPKRELFATRRDGQNRDDASVPEPVQVVPTQTWCEDEETPAEVRDLPSRLEERFELVGQIAEGGMGRIVLGRDVNLRRTVAIKVISEKLLERKDLVGRFRAEAQIVAQLEHPSIIPIYSCEQTAAGHPAFTMKLIHGRTLTDYVDDCITRCAHNENPDQEHRLSTRLERFIKICDAMKFAHARGVVHRDIKPDNIMIGDFEEVYVMDWGLARLVDGTDDDVEPVSDVPGLEEAKKTRVGDAVGTLTHMPPEQARGEVHRMGTSVDLYALGMILFELVTLEEPRPFDGNLDDLRQRALQGQVRRIDHRHNRPIPRGLAAIIRKATAPDATDRYASVDELGDDIRRFLRGDELAVAPDSLLRKVGRWMGHNPAVVLGGLLAVAIAGAGVWVMELQNRLAAEAAQLEQSRAIAELVGEVSRRAQRLDGRAQSVKILVEGLAAETVLALARPAASEHHFPQAASFEHADTAPQTAIMSDRYKQRVSWVEPSWVAAPNSDPATIESSLDHLAGLEDRLRSMMARSVDAPEFKDAAANGTLTADEQILLLKKETAFLQYTYLGFENGLLLNYPGLGNFGALYDPRKRPWYTSNVGHYGARWGIPYPDAAGSAIMVPCNLPMYDETGRFMGVAGAGMRLDDVVAALQSMGDEEGGIDGFIDATLVDRTGVVVVSSQSDVTVAEGTGLNDNKTLPRVLYDDDQVREMITSGKTTEQIIGGDTITVVSHLNSTDWSLVVRVDRSAYD